jgi:hypothetical protein
MNSYIITAARRSQGDFNNMRETSRDPHFTRPGKQYDKPPLRGAFFITGPFPRYRLKTNNFWNHSLSP